VFSRGEMCVLRQTSLKPGFGAVRRKFSGQNRTPPGQIGPPPGRVPGPPQIRKFGPPQPDFDPQIRKFGDPGRGFRKFGCFGALLGLIGRQFGPQKRSNLDPKTLKTLKKAPLLAKKGPPGQIPRPPDPTRPQK